MEKIFKPNQIKKDPESLQYYGKDWTTYFNISPSSIVFPESTEQVVQLVKWARQNKIALVPSGGRTGLSGGACATQGEVVVSFERMNQILDFNPTEPSVRVQAGVVTEVLQNFAVEKGFYYPVDFAARGSSHVGGNIATNAGGIKVLRYGMTRDWVMGLKVVTGAGEVLELNKSLIKNATGLDLRQLMIGSEGILGFVTEATMRLAPAPPPHRVLLLAVTGLEAVMKVFAELRSRVTLSAFEMFSEKALEKVLAGTGLPRPLEGVSPFYVVAEFECRSEADEALGLEAFEKSLEQAWISDGLMSQSDVQAKTFWRYREDISESLARFSPYKNDVSVRVSLVPQFLSELEALLSSVYPTWTVIWFGHIGDGNLHINILRPDGMSKDDFVKECRNVDKMVFQVVQKFEGAISAEHGVGLTKKDFLSFSRSGEEIQLMRQIKKIMDPDGIMNPGKIFD